MIAEAMLSASRHDSEWIRSITIKRMPGTKKIAAVQALTSAFCADGKRIALIPTKNATATRAQASTASAQNPQFASRWESVMQGIAEYTPIIATARAQNSDSKPGIRLMSFSA